MTFEAELETRHRRRISNENRTLARLERLEKRAAPMVGELASGRFYAFPVGGKYKESASHTEIVDYLIRNGYVS